MTKASTSDSLAKLRITDARVAGYSETWVTMPRMKPNSSRLTTDGETCTSIPTFVSLARAAET